MHHFAIWSVTDVHYLCVQCFLVELDCAGCIAHGDVRCEGMEAFGNCFYFFGHGTSIRIKFEYIEVGTATKMLISSRDSLQPATNPLGHSLFTERRGVPGRRRRTRSQAKTPAS